MINNFSKLRRKSLRGRNSLCCYSLPSLQITQWFFFLFLLKNPCFYASLSKKFQTFLSFSYIFLSLSLSWNSE
ncbi:hypothetical protein RIF29_16177 [Crotalaria pallida]|uniref:Uncharacterized protein n=1 Tax=Crotalaria pallida TaxID=3830 RepID=A0AAN9FKI8_CROPI